MAAAKKAKQYLVKNTLIYRDPKTKERVTVTATGKPVALPDDVAKEALARALVMPYVADDAEDDDEGLTDATGE